jgi:hypothetical protein
MNNTFELKRFSLVFKKLLFERSIMLYGSFTLVALFTWFIYHTTIGVHFNISSFQMYEMQAFAIGLNLGGIYWVATGFNYFAHKEEGYNYLTLPASHFEKWLSVLLLLFVFFVFYCLFFRVLDTLYINYLKNHLNLPQDSYANKMYFYRHVEPLSFWGNTSVSMMAPYSIFIYMTGLMAIGGLYFNKTALIKTIFASIGLFILFHYFHYFIAEKIFQTEVKIIPFMMPTIILNKGNEVTYLPQPILLIYSVLFTIVLPISFWLIALIRLREKEF